MPLSRVRLIPAGHDRIYGNVAMFVSGLPLHPSEAARRDSAAVRGGQWVVAKIARELGINVTGGSSSVVDAWEVLRLAAATARAQLLGAASLAWKQPADELKVKDGVVSHPSGASAHYGELAKAAASTPSGTVQLKPASEWTADRQRRAAARRRRQEQRHGAVRHGRAAAGPAVRRDPPLPDDRRQRRRGRRRRDAEAARRRARGPARLLCRLDRGARGRRPQRLACAPGRRGARGRVAAAAGRRPRQRRDPRRARAARPRRRRERRRLRLLLARRGAAGRCARPVREP